MEIREKGMIETTWVLSWSADHDAFAMNVFSHTRERERDGWGVLEGGCLISKTYLCVLDGPPPLLITMLNHILSYIYIYIYITWTRSTK